MANNPAWWTMVPLHEALLICAGQHVTAAYEAETEATAKSGDLRAVSFAAVKASQHAGAVVELLAKSLLAKEHPALILSNVADAIPSPQHPLELKRTSEAARLLTMLRMQLGLDPKTETLGASILNDRNSAVHVGLSKLDALDTVERLGLWIHHIEKASKLRATDWLSAKVADEQDSRFNAFILAVKKKLTRAVSKFEQKERDWKKPDESFQDYVQRLEAEPVEATGDEVFEEICPACHSHGSLSRVVEDVEYEYEGPGEYSATPIYSDSFRCPVCELELTDAEVTTVFDPSWKGPRVRLHAE